MLMERLVSSPNLSPIDCIGTNVTWYVVMLVEREFEELLTLVVWCNKSKPATKKAPQNMLLS